MAPREVRVVWKAAAPRNQNTGAAFGILQGGRPLSVVAIAISRRSSLGPRIAGQRLTMLTRLVLGARSQPHIRLL